MPAIGESLNIIKISGLADKPKISRPASPHQMVNTAGQNCTDLGNTGNLLEGAGKLQLKAIQTIVHLDLAAQP